MRLRAWSIGLLLTLGWGSNPPYVVRLPITPEYREWWFEMQQCSGIYRPIESVTFWVVNDTMIMLKGHVYRVAASDLEAGAVFITRGNEQTRKVVAHEVLHHLLGRPGHPQVPFVVPCGIMEDPTQKTQDW